jgi:hypothetical protein
MLLLLLVLLLLLLLLVPPVACFLGCRCRWRSWTCGGCVRLLRRCGSSWE